MHLCMSTDGQRKKTRRQIKIVRLLSGYSDTQKGYRLFCLDTGKILISRDVKFQEQHFSAAQSQTYAEFAISHFLKDQKQWEIH